VPEFGDLDWSASRFDAASFATVMAHDRTQWERELAAHDELFARLGDKRPVELVAERNRLAARLAT
jgi:GTP-dependent phosphoenolpyruvate carboxykinase